MRLRKVRDAALKIASHRELVPEDPKIYKGHWQDFFHNARPIHLEIGMGKGQFLILMAQKYPMVNFIGIEKEASVLVRAVEKAAALRPVNLVFLQLDAFTLSDYFAADEIAQIYLYFADPWPKKRHEKRRLTCPKMLTIYRNILINGGLISMKTDSEQLYLYSLENFQKYGFHILYFGLNKKTDEPKTEYEERFLKQNKAVYLIASKNQKEEIKCKKV